MTLEKLVQAAMARIVLILSLGLALVLTPLLGISEVVASPSVECHGMSNDDSALAYEACGSDHQQVPCGVFGGCSSISCSATLLHTVPAVISLDQAPQLHQASAEQLLRERVSPPPSEPPRTDL